MIIFDIDNTLANCEHRRLWKPDRQVFYEACDKDKPINPTINILRTLWIKDGEEIEIWSGRSESVRKKTEEWLTDNVFGDTEHCRLKMRPIGDHMPDHKLKERWLDELIQNSIGKFMLKEKDYHKGVNEIDFVFDADPKSIAMYRRRGIFVFDCNQDGRGF